MKKHKRRKLLHKRRKMLLSEIIQSNYYRSILLLTEKLSNGKKGPRQLHYRWFLLKNHDNIKSTVLINQYHLQELEKKLEGELLFWLTSQKSLNKFLHKLVKDYGLLEITQDEGITYYKLTEKYIPELHRALLIQKIKELPDNVLTNESYKKILDTLENADYGAYLTLVDKARKINEKYQALVEKTKKHKEAEEALAAKK